MGKKIIEKSVFVSDEQLRSPSEGNIYGRYFEKSGIFNIFPSDLQANGSILGKILPKGSEPSRSKLCGIITEGGVDFYSFGKKIDSEIYSLYQNIFSRNTGILESDVMAEKRVIILGCGSVGSLVALELARAGVQHFILVDADILEYHNVCRHQCGIEDVGDLNVLTLSGDIMDTVWDPSALASELFHAEDHPLDTLLNNHLGANDAPFENNAPVAQAPENLGINPHVDIHHQVNESSMEHAHVKFLIETGNV